MHLSGEAASLPPSRPASPAAPLGAAEAGALLRDQLPRAARRLVLAVSGGADSTALLVFAALNRERLARDLCAVTVDHALRVESAAEAGAVGALAARLGIEHRTLRWDEAPAPGNLSAQARAARYRLLVRAAREWKGDAVVTAHHEDDQIETHRMAWLRGEGAGRLAGMRGVRDLDPGLLLCRPWLSVPKARLVAGLRALGIAWTDDPTNRDPRYLRPRLRAELAGLGAKERASLLGRIAVAARERDGLDALVARALRDARVDDLGAIRLPRAALEGAGGSALLSRALAAAGGSARPASLREIERLRDRLGAMPHGGAATLGGCRVVAADGEVEVAREFGRIGPPEARVRAGARRVTFDERFDIDLPAGTPEGRVVALRHLGRGGARDATLPVLLDAAGGVVAAHPAALARLGSGAGALSLRERVGWRLRRDLRWIIQNVAKEPAPVGKDFAADYLGRERATRPQAGEGTSGAETPIQDG